MRSRERNVVVIGAGFGGLAAAIELASRGVRTTVVERDEAPGGKARPARISGVELDAGPTVLTMPWVFDELFDRAGASFRTAVELVRAEELARHRWSDGACLDLFADRERSRDAIGAVFGAKEARAFADFCDDGRRIFAVAEGPFLRAQRPTMGSIVKQFGFAGLGALRAIDSHRTMWTALCDRFASPRLRQLFGRYATYCGSSPFQAPATLNLVAHVEAEGVYRALGGMRSVASALEALARSKGVTFRYGREVDRVVVERGRVTAVGTRQEQFPADVVVFNGDVSAIGGLLSDGGARAPSPTPARARSLSAVTWLLRARTSGAALGHHNVFFSDDYRAEFDELDRSRRMPAQPTVYVCAQDRGDGAEGPAIERLLVLSNAPATGDEPARWDDRERARCTTSTFGWLERLGLTVDPMESVQTTPVEFHARFPATGGALYGARSDSPLSALSRQGAKSNIDGLYFAGGSVHPGPGVPMATLSGRLAASQILADLE